MHYNYCKKRSGEWMLKSIKYILLALLVYGCTAHPNIPLSEKIVSNHPVEDIVPLPDFCIVSGFEQDNNEELGIVLKDIFAEFDIPVTMTPKVKAYLQYFTTSGRQSMQNWINRSNKYLYLVSDIFQKEGVPLDLVALAFTESGFNPRAKSHAGAVGMWQFMKSTGKMYGLNVNEWVDERRDFVKATQAAARHLKDLYRSFGDWYLALAAYNAGSGKISRATKAHKTKDFFMIAKGRTLKLETKDYVPKYLAQLLIYKNIGEYGFTEPNTLPILYGRVEVTKQVNLYVLADTIGVTVDELKELNPELLTPMTPPVKNYTVRVPLTKYDEAFAFLTNPDSDVSRYKAYNAKAGETITSIARKHNVSASVLKQINNFKYDKIYTPKVLYIPSSNIKISDVDLAFAADIGKRSPKYYTVKKGDSLTLISRMHNLPLNTLVKLNPNVNPRYIYPGQVLIVSKGG